MDNPIQSINLYPVNSATDYPILTYWIVIYLLDSAIQRLYNWRLYFIAFIIWLLDIACLFAYSKRSFLLKFFFPSSQNIIGRARRVQMKNVVLLCCCRFTQKRNISIKRLSSAGVFIACESCFTCACVTSHSITTHCINVTAVRAGRAFVNIYIQKCYNYKNLKASSLHTYIIFIMLTLEFFSSL